MDATYRTLTSALALREFTVTSLAEEAGVGAATVRTVLNRNRIYFDVGTAASGRRGGQPRIWTVRDDRRSDLEAAMSEIDGRFIDQQESGLELTDAGRLTSPAALRLRVPSANPELATSDDLDAYYLEPSKSLLPRLVQRLLVSTPGVTGPSVPVGEGIQLPGFDGRVTAETETLYVPAGHSAWEVGAGADPPTKASSDLAKRTKDPGPVVPAETTFVFTSMRRFRKKDDWASAKRAQGAWKDIRVVDADDLYAWVLSEPAVHIWLSAEMGLHPTEVVTLQRWFESWQGQTLTPLPPGILKAGRTEQAQLLRQTCIQPGQVASVHSNSREESLAFVAATLLGDASSTEDVADVAKLASALLVRTPREWARLVDSPSSGVLIPEFTGADVVFATTRGLSVVLPLGLGADQRRATVVLPRIDLIDAAQQLVEAGLHHEEAERIAHAVDRSLTSFRRSAAVNPDFDRPRWAESSADLIAALTLLGSWDANSETDQNVIARATQRTYAEVESSLQLLASREDPPLFRSGNDWQLSSPQDAFVLVEGSITGHILGLWRDLAQEVLREQDPILDVAPGEEIQAATSGVGMKHSQALRAGIARGAALLGTFGQLSLSTTADLLVRELLGDSSDARIWMSLSPVLPSLAEASPDEFLAAVEDGVGGSTPMLKAMFTDSGPPPLLGGHSPHTQLLWALEVLCRAPGYAERACFVLARLAEIDPGGRLGNRPFDSLRRVLLPWHPQIVANAPERQAIVETVLSRYPDIGWRLILSLLPGNFDSTHPTYSATFRDWRVSPEISMTEQYDGWKALTELAIRVAIGDPSRLLQLLETMQALHPDDRAALLRELGAVDSTGWDADGRLNAWRTISDLIAKHRQFPNAQWVLPEGDLEALESIAASWAPDDPVKRWAMLFVQFPKIPLQRFPINEEYDVEVARLRHEALTQIRAEAPSDGPERLTDESPEPFTVGRAIADDLGDTVDGQMLMWLDGAEQLSNAAQGWLGRMSEIMDSEWLASKLKIVAESSEQTRLRVYGVLGQRDEVLDLIRSETPEIRRDFWQANPILSLRSNRVEEITTELVKHDRARWAISYLAHKTHDQAIPHELVVQALFAAAAPGAFQQEYVAMFDYEVGVLLDYLENGNADEQTQFDLEWQYFGLLEYTRPPRALFRRLEQSPDLFVGLVCILFRGAHEEPPTEVPDANASARWRTAYSLLREWRRPPGTRDDGKIDGDTLTRWVWRARELLIDADRQDIGDECIGQLLSGSSEGSDKIWPSEHVRDLLEEIPGRHIRAGLEMGRFNARGVTSRGAFEGGRQERSLATLYDASSRSVAPRWPNTARVLRDMARNYQEWAAREDARDEQWRDGR